MEPTGALVVGAADGDCALALATTSAAADATIIAIPIAFAKFIFPLFVCDSNRDRDAPC
jgi:hypothetical protein